MREDYERWLSAQRVRTLADGQSGDPATLTFPEIPATLPFAGYVVWFHGNLTYLDIRFDHQRFAIVTQQVASAAEAFYFDHLEAAYGHAGDAADPCLILYAKAAGAPVCVVG
uniref:Uncharacterized protein n=2 Tax=Pandoraea faecigallinarum TaxID=656179 RepID=A0A0H3WPV9_9BURK